ncbi:MAG: guanine deaminase [Candidatus Cloacimonadales bacterium]|jgi:guanine deaminase|nr:guanine deaminase [Candidatus Cloacimonadota bacterium]MDD2650243.1 guanine deaminase [Candidatus Cloacimonadota bacterium]MDX9977333.1 guanine deaminase [Candidatus Cloacimonadales bacterium]
MIIKTNYLSYTNKKELVFQKNIFLEIQNNKIASIKERYNGDHVDYSNMLAVPGFIDTHTHIPQINIMGKQKPNLLEWLNINVFPEEGKFKDPEYADNVSKDFFDQAIKNGTTCLVAYSSTHREACNIAFKNANNAGIRAFIGKTMMDSNSPSKLVETTQKSLEDSVYLYEQWHNKTPLLNYIFSPRFAITCSIDLMKEVGTFIHKNNAYLQTHLSESLNEIATIKSIYPKYKSYTDIYYQCGLMSSKSIFGHCVHLSDDEIRLLKDTKSKIAYCADSNFYLKSGKFDLEKITEFEVPFAFASDIGAGTSFYMPYHAKISSYRQDSIYIEPQKAFYLMTLAGAEVLSLEDKIGSIETGKEADMVFYNYQNFQGLSSDDIVSKLIYTDQSNQIEQVMIAGKELL